MDAVGILRYVAEVSLRAGCVGLVVFGITRLLKKRAAMAHLAWLITALSMIGMLTAGWLLPPLAVRLLPAERPAAVVPAAPGPVVYTAPAASRPVAPDAGGAPAWPQVLVLAYAGIACGLLARLALGGIVARRTIARAKPVEGLDGVRESAQIRVPVTTGWLRPVILLPPGWRAWSDAKREAVLAHERAHVRRRDNLSSLAARVNRALFWFHPLSWWIDRELGRLAERICDDASIRAFGEREDYAQVLLEIASEVRVGGRLVPAGIAMARSPKVAGRIDAILDSSRPLTAPLSVRAALAACLAALPLMYVAAAAQVVPGTNDAPDDLTLLMDGFKLTPEDVSRMEARLHAQPEDQAARGKLISYYFQNARRQERLDHILWLVENHPESPLLRFRGSLISPVRTPITEPGDYERAKALWLVQVDRHPDDVRVVRNAAEALSAEGDWHVSADLLIRARRNHPDDAGLLTDLAYKYARAINAGRPGAREALRSLNDAPLSAAVDPLVSHFATNLPAPAQPSGAESRRLVQKPEPVYPPLAQQARIQGTVRLKITVDRTGGVQNISVIAGHPLLVPAAIEAVKKYLYEPGMESSTTVDVNFILPGAVTMESQAVAPPPFRDLPVYRPVRVDPEIMAKKLKRRVDPEYPPLARQARVEGDVELSIVVMKDGTVRGLTVVSGHPLLAPAAVEAVKLWVYEPVLLNGQPTDVMTTAKVEFRLEPRTASADTANAGALRIDPDVQARKLTNNVRPVYPPLAEQARIQGTVRFNLVIGEDGRVKNTQLVSGHPLLVPAAIEAVKQWVYEPTLLNGRPVEVRTMADVQFQLPGAPPAPPAAPLRIRVGGKVQESKLRTKVEPEYPPLARESKIEGTVVFNVTIDKEGKVASVQYVSGESLLAPAAEAAVRQYLYAPTLLNGNPIEVVTQVAVPFKLP